MNHILLSNLYQCLVLRRLSTVISSLQKWNPISDCLGKCSVEATTEYLSLQNQVSAVRTSNFRVRDRIHKPFSRDHITMTFDKSPTAGHYNPGSEGRSQNLELRTQIQNKDGHFYHIYSCSVLLSRHTHITSLIKYPNICNLLSCYNHIREKESHCHSLP